MLGSLPGTVRPYRTWQELHAGLQELLAGCRRVAMQYSSANNVPYVARVDAGTIELVRQFGVEVGSAADLIQRFEAVWTPTQYASHRRVADAVHEVMEEAFGEVARCRRGDVGCSERALQQFIIDRFTDRGLVTSHASIVAVSQHSADPHYQLPDDDGQRIGADDFLLVDLWAKEADGVYADITWTGYVGATVPPCFASVFDIVCRARDAGVEAVRHAVRTGMGIRGCDVDQAVRGVIAEAGYGEYFLHCTGHSIGVEVHDNGANIDSLETPDTRRLLSATGFSIEPGIYLPGEFGVRSEINVYVDDSDILVTGGPVQDAVVAIMKSPL